MSSRARHGSIEVPAVGSLPALVEFDAAHHGTALLLVRPLLHSLDSVVGTHVCVDVTTERGLMHVDARIAGIRDGEVLDLDIAGGPPAVIQRRDFARVDAVLDVRIAPDTAAVAVNISGSGAVISRLDGLRPGDPVDLSLQLGPHEPPILINGRVVRETEGHLRAVHFEQVAQADRERIVQFVFERQRLERRRLNRT